MFDCCSASTAGHVDARRWRQGPAQNPRSSGRPDVGDVDAVARRALDSGVASAGVAYKSGAVVTSGTA